MVAPALIVYCLYFALPLGLSVYYSFTSFSGTGSAAFVGVTNYRSLVHDPFFWSSFRNTGIILAESLLFMVPVAFILALMMRDRVARGGQVLRALIFAPVVIAPILVGLIFVFIFDPDIGMVNHFLTAVGVHSPPQWIGGVTLTPYVVGAVYVWENLGFVLTIFYAGLQLQPREPYEAAAIDGAGFIAQVRFITIPMLRETFGICTVLVITGVFRIFELVYQLTGGGPVHDSDVLVSYMYYLTFGIFQYGYGMALAVVICVVSVGVFGSYMLLFGRARHG
jgi:raffinose/stachyose/melibiose transport system permease protein